MNTNNIVQVLTQPQQLQSWYTSNQMLFAMYGGLLIHAYHSIVNAGGIKAICSKFWDSRNTQLKQSSTTVPPLNP